MARYLEEISLYPAVPTWFKICQFLKLKCQKGSHMGFANTEETYKEWFKRHNNNYETGYGKKGESAEYKRWIQDHKILNYAKRYDKKGEIIYVWYKWENLILCRLPRREQE